MKMLNVLQTAALLGVIGSLTALSPVRAAGPFDGLAGQWSGAGTISMSDGSSERLRCSATYDVAGSALKLRMTCASDAYKIDARSDVRYSDGFLSGHWSESSKNLGGDVSGSASGNTIRANLESGGSTLLSLTMTTSGSAQNVRIIPQQGTGIKNVQISMTRK